MAHKQEGPHWQVDKSLKECMAHMLQNDFEFNDVTFNVHCTHGQKNKKSETIRALQLLLLARSPVFYSMFTGDLAQSDRPTIDIPDIEPPVFKELLRYIYTDEVHLTTENVTAVLYASKKYVITNLTKKCVGFLEDHMSPDSLPTILEQSVMYDEDELKEKVLEKIQSEATSVLSSQEFTSISKQALQSILELNLKISNELEVFHAAMKWAEKKCEEMKKPQEGKYHREALGECFNSIRFPTMDIDDFNDVVAPSDVLTADEGYQLFRYMTAKSKKPAFNLPFSTEPRHHNSLAASPSHPIPDATPRKLIIPGPYKQTFLIWQEGTYTSQVECQLSDAITLKTLYIHATYPPLPLTVTLIQNGTTQHSYSGTAPLVTAATQDMPEHHAVAVNKRVAAGALQLNIKVQNTSGYHGFIKYSSLTAQLADANLQVAISNQSGDNNFLLGFEYALAL